MRTHCRQCSKVLRMMSNRLMQTDFCSRKCSLAYIAENGLRKTLTNEQEAKIIAARLADTPYKVIAINVGCTPAQATHVWRYHRNRGSELFRRQQYALRTKAKTALAAEIAAAKAEMATSQPFKVGLLGEW